MLDKVKSSYFAKVIFSFINDKRQLELVKHSKYMQKKLNINIINYKVFYGKFIRYGINGKMREYLCYNQKMIFEGEYLGNKRNGYGKEYDFENGSLIFEGEYSNGKRNGKGKEYYANGNILFEGEYKNGKKWIGIGYDRNNNTLYELINGKGYVKEYFNRKDTLKFEGEYLNGERNGKGKEFDYHDNLIFEGEYLNGKRYNGNGYDESGNIIYQLNKGNGKVKEYFNYSDKLKYEGGYVNGERNGFCKIFFEDKLIFIGKYINGKRNENGKEYDYDCNLIFEGEYLYDFRIKGKEYIQGRLVFEGEYLFNKKWNGKGYDEKGNIIYELNNGNGKIKEYYYNGNIEYEGDYLNGRRHGKGKEYYFNGKLRYEGEYLYGKIIKGINVIKKFDDI